MHKNHSLTLSQIQQLLRATPKTLQRELAGLDADMLCWQPAQEEWSINECVGHLIECDKNGFAGRIQTILAEDQPQLVAWDVAGAATQRRDNDHDGLELIAELNTMRQENTGFITTLTPEQLVRAGIHPLIGELRVVDLIFEWVHHDRNHIKQILTNIQDYIWPDLGNAQRFFQAELNPYL